MSRKNIIIYVTPSLPPFVKNDIGVLEEKFRVITNLYNWKNKPLVIFFMLHQLFFFLSKASNAKAIIISFGGLWSVIPSIVGRITGTPVFIILNGTDCASIPDLKYGSLRKNIIRTACKISYRWCKVLLPVSESLVKVKNTYYADDAFSFQGFRHFFPDLKTKHQTIYNGIDPDFWEKPTNLKKQDGSFIAVFNQQQFILKGGDLIHKLALRFPELEFTIVGCNQPEGLEPIPDNLKFSGRLTPEKLREAYGKAQFHFQLSIFEGFGFALCEAMLCECIPIVSSVNMLPEIAGESGFVIEKRDVNLLENTIRKALNVKNYDELGKVARQHIVNNFSLKLRKNKLLAILENYTGTNDH